MIIGHIWVKPQYTGTWTDFSDGSKGDLLKLIQQQTGLSFREAIDFAAKFTGHIPGEIAKTARVSKAELTPKVPLVNSKMANYLVSKSTSIAGTHAETYLKNIRGIAHIGTNYDLRFNPEITSKVNGQKLPALLVVGRDSEGEIQSTQAVYLDQKTGEKAKVDVQKQTFTSVKGALFCANPLGAKTANTAIVCDGTEDALSIASVVKDCAVYASFGSKT